MRNFQRIATGVNVTPLMLAISRRPELWKRTHSCGTTRRGPSAKSTRSCCAFREGRLQQEQEPPDRKVALYKAELAPGFDQHESVDYPAYATSRGKPLVMGIFAAVAGERLGA
jgi:hypothetical protein